MPARISRISERVRVSGGAVEAAGSGHRRNESEPSDSLMEHRQEPFWPFGRRVLRPRLPVRLRGRESAMARMASDSAERSAFAVSDRRSVYHRAKGTAATEPAVSSFGPVVH